MSSLIKEINRLISKWMYILLFDISDRYFLVQLKKWINMSNIYY